MKFPEGGASSLELALTSALVEASICVRMSPIVVEAGSPKNHCMNELMTLPVRRSGVPLALSSVEDASRCIMGGVPLAMLCGVVVPMWRRKPSFSPRIHGEVPEAFCIIGGVPLAEPRQSPCSPIPGPCTSPSP